MPILLPVCTFGVHVALGGQLEPGLVFSSLALLDLVRNPMNAIPQAIQGLVQVYVGMRRIESLLQADEVEQQVATNAEYVCVSSGGESVAIQMREAKLAWAPQKQNDDAPAVSEAGVRKCCADIVRRCRGRPSDQQEKTVPLLGVRVHSGGNADAVSPGRESSQPSLTVTLRLLAHISPIQIPKGKLVFVCGAVGAGKSTLMAGLLNEISQTAGTIRVQTPTAYCSQVAWIQHGTVKDNIIFGDEYDEGLFEQVVHACAIGPDLEELRDGVDTLIGERGISLSGGQKARISLARAAYKYKSTATYLLDDPLSAVDAHVAKHLVQECLGSTQGLLRNSTRILVTHQLQYLKEANLVVVLKDGEIVACRESKGLTEQELLSYGLQLSVTTSPHPGSGGKSSAEPRLVSNQPEAGTSRRPPLGRWMSDRPLQRPRAHLVRWLSDSTFNRHDSERDPDPSGNEDQVGDSASEHEAATTEEGQSKSTTAQAAPSSTEEQSERGGLSMEVWCAYAKTMGPCLSGLVLTLFITSNLLQLASSLWLADWSEKAVEDNSGSRRLFGLTPRQAFLTPLDILQASSAESHSVDLVYRFGVYSLLSLLAVACFVARMLIFIRASLSVSTVVHAQALWCVLRSPQSWLDSTPTGQIVNRFSQDMQKLDMELITSVSGFVGSGVNLVISVITIFVFAPVVIIVLAPLWIVYNRVQRRFRGTAREMQRLLSSSRSPIFQGLDEVIAGVSTIRAFNRKQFFAEANAARCALNIKLNFNIVVLNRWLTFRLKALGIVPVLFVTVGMVLESRTSFMKDSLSGATAGVVLRYSLQLIDQLQSLLMMLTNTELNLVALERVRGYTALAMEPPLEAEADSKFGTWPLEGRIEFQNVTMRYRPDLPRVLNGISFTIPGGTSVGIVGRTGAGKSSILHALFNFGSLEGGRICIDNVDIGSLGLHTLRRRLAIIPQDPVGFTGTLRFNLDPFNEHADSKLWRELEKVQMESFFRSKPEGLDFCLSSGGENLSVGQRQLVCVARAFLRGCRLLILDEATASVDFQTDELIQEVLRREVTTNKLTTITIAHRINTILGNDNVLVMEKGRAAEFGNPSSLASDPKTKFYSFVHAADDD